MSQNSKLKEEELADLPVLKSHDPLARLFLHLGLSPLSLFFVILVLNFFTDAILAVVFRAWSPFQISSTVASPGLSGEIGAWTLDFFAHPIIMGFFLWTSYAGESLVKSLNKTGSLVKDDEVSKILKAGTTRINEPWLSWTALILAIFIQATFTFLIAGFFGEPSSSWINAHLVVLLTRTFLGIVVNYALIKSVFHLWIILKNISKIASLDKFILKPFDPDQAAGLGVIGKFIANEGYVFFAFGIVVIGIMWQAFVGTGLTDRVWIIGATGSTIAFLLLAVLFFLISVYPTHNAMVRYKASYLKVISTELEGVYKKALSEKAPSSANETMPIVQRLKDLGELTNTFPVWPFNHQSLRKYFVLVASPIATLFVRILFEWIDSLI